MARPSNQSPTGGADDVTYTLSVTPVAVIGTPTAACPSIVALGFDTTTSVAGTSNAAAGGPTAGALVCYSLTEAVTSCVAGNVGGNIVTCFTPTVAAPTTNVSVTTNNGIYYKSCATGLVGASGPKATLVTLYAPPTITVDGVLNATEWSTSAVIGDLFASSVPGIEGGYTFGTTTVTNDTLYFALSGFTGAATTDGAFYVNDNPASVDDANYSLTGVGALGFGSLPFPAHYAISVPTGPAGTVAVLKWTYAENAWTSAALGTATAVATASGLEVSIPVTSVNSPTTVNVAGGVVTGVGTTTPVLGAGWPQYSGGFGFVSDTLLSCQTPAAQVQ